MAKCDWAAFGKAVMNFWPDGAPDGFDLQHLAEEHGIIKRSAGGYDPARHGENDVCADKGDEWFYRNYRIKGKEGQADG